MPDHHITALVWGLGDLSALPGEDPLGDLSALPGSDCDSRHTVLYHYYFTGLLSAISPVSRPGPAFTTGMCSNKRGEPLIFARMSEISSSTQKANNRRL